MKARPRAPLPRARSGYTLLEMLMVATLFAVSVGSVGMLLSSGNRAYQTSTLESSLVQQGRRALDRIAATVTRASTPSVEVLATGAIWYDAVDLDCLEDVAADGTKTWRPTAIRWTMEPDELDDGLDNNGNGLVDEGVVELVQDEGTAQELRVVLARWVSELGSGEEANGLDDDGDGLIDEGGLCVTRDGDRLSLQIHLERRDKLGTLVSKALSTSVRTRN